MNRVSAQRKVTKSKSNPSKDAANVEIETFKVLLAGLTGSELKKHLSKVPKRLTGEELHILLHMLKKLDVKVDQARDMLDNKTKLHCVRCHKEYLERNNGVDACHILHDELEPEEEIGGGDWLWSCDHCFRKALGQDDCVDEFEICFNGRHTTDVGVANHGYHPENCEDHGCYDD